MDVADSYKRMSGNGREKKTGSLSESAVRFFSHELVLYFDRKRNV